MSFTVLILIFVLATAAWAFADAPQWGLSRFWGLGSVLFWFPVFFLYLLVRSSRRGSVAATPMPRTAPPAGWYSDPTVGNEQRWWDGVDWTEHTRPTVREQAPTSS
jgi:hypothetical protein